MLHSLPIGYGVDDASGISDPRGMLARKFGIDMHVVTTDVSVARNLMLAVERCHLNVEAMVASPYVAGLSVLADDEGDLGAAVVDMGAGTTTIAVFSGGRFIHADGFALGGRHVTMDLARGLNARISDAERIKTLYGSVLAGGIRRARHDRGAVGRCRRARGAAVRFARQPRAHHQAAHRGDSGNGARPAGGLAVRGRAARTRGAHRRREPAHRPAGSCRGRFSAARCGSAGRSASRGLPEEAKGPAFAVATGLLIYPQAAHLEHFEPRRTRHTATGTGGYIARVGRWLRESF